MSNKRIFILLIAALPLIAGAVVAKRIVAENYKRTQAAVKEHNLREAQKEEMVQEATRREATLAELRKAVELNPSSVKAHWALADFYQQIGMLDKANEEVATIAKLDPKNKEAAVALANIKLALGKMKDAEGAYRQLTRQWPKDLEAWQGLAATLYHQKRYREAGEAALRALRLKPDDFGSRYIFACSALEYASQFPPTDIHAEAIMAARSQFKRMTKEDPENGDFFYKLGRASFLVLDKKGALEAMRRAFQLLPERQDVAADYAQTLISTGEKEEARRIVEASIQKFPKMGSLHYMLSDLLQNTKDANALQRSLEEARKAVELDPRIPIFHERLGSAYLRLNDLKGARSAYEQALLLDPNRAKPYQQLAAIYTRLGDTRRAAAAAKMGTRMVANDQTLRQVQELSSKYTNEVPLLLVLADRYRDLRMTGAARDTYLQILKLDPKNARAQAGLAAIAAKQKAAGNAGS